MHAKIYHLHTLSPLHCGTGQSAGVVDLPIARARATQLPMVPGSSLRGVIRAHLEGEQGGKDRATALFGPRNVNSAEDAFAGVLAMDDAHLLLLPVRALAGILCYVTCPFVLRRYRRDLLRANLSAPGLPSALDSGQAKVPPASVNLQGNKLVLEDLDLDAMTNDANLGAWGTQIAQTVHADDATAQQDLASRLALVPDEVFSFLAETATEVRTRIAIDPKTGTVKRGALWYEENLPAEAVLWGIYARTSWRKSQDEALFDGKLDPFAPETLLQLGGHAGVGRGLVRLMGLEVNHA